MPFLPDLPLAVNHALALGALLALGIAGGELARRMGFPIVSGYIFAGLALGSSGLGEFARVLLDEAKLVIDVALGLLLFDLGRRLDLDWMQRDRSLWFAAIADSAVSFAAVLLVLLAFELSPIEAAMAAAIGMATSPGVVLLVAKDASAQGQVTDRCLCLTALNSLVAFILVATLLGAMHHEQQAAWTTVVVHPLYLLVGSVLLGIGTGAGLLGATRLCARRDSAHFAAMVSAVLCAVGIAAMLELSVLIALLAAGAAVRNAPRRFALLEPDTGEGSRLLYVLLFVGTGASLPLPRFDWAVIGFVFARALGKWLGPMAAAPFAPLPWRQSALLGVSLLPMSAVAVILMHDVARLFPEAGARVGAIVFPAILIFAVIAPPLMQWALARAGDRSPERR